MKPMNRKSYGSIPHLLGSRMGMGELTLKEINEKFGTNFSGEPESVTTQRENGEEVIHDFWVKCGSYYFKKGVQILPKGKLPSMKLDTRLF